MRPLPEWGLPIFDGRVRSPLMVAHYLGARSGQGGVLRGSEGSSLMAANPQVDSAPGGVAWAAFWPQTVGWQPT